MCMRGTCIHLPVLMGVDGWVGVCMYGCIDLISEETKEQTGRKFRDKK